MPETQICADPEWVAGKLDIQLSLTMQRPGRIDLRCKHGIATSMDDPHQIIVAVSMGVVRDLFESHLTVVDLPRSMAFFGQTLGLELAEVFWERRVAFYWIGGRGNSMLGLWEVGTSPHKLSLHLAFRVDLRDLLDAPARFRAADVVPLDFWGQPTEEPVVLAWMPAASLYFRDPDGNMLEFLSMLPDAPQPELGIISWSRWNQSQRVDQG